MSVSEAVAVPMMCSVPGCTKPAISTYVWAWGETGACCAEHQVVLQQKAKNLKRTIQFNAIAPGAPTPMTRDERVQLHAARLAAEDETIEAKQRTAKLYDQNQVLATELGKSNRRSEDAAREIERLNEALNLLTDRHDTALEELQTAKDEIVRLQTLVDALQGSQLAPTQRER